MKFLPVFGVVFLLNAAFHMLFMDTIYGSLWFMIAKESMIFALAIYAFARQDDKMEILEKRIRELEEKKGEE